MQMLLLCLYLAGNVLAGELVDRVVADVGGQLVLLSDVNRETVLAEVDVGGTPFWDPTWQSPEERLIDAAIVRTIAADVALYEPTRKDVERRLEAIRARFPNRRGWRAFLDRIAVDETRLGFILCRRLVVDRYLRRNLLADPADPDAFKAAAELHLGELRSVARIRRIPPADVPTP
ncbi:MAG: hypothetical protein AAF602_16465 [Myxococcota bacterium]